MASETIGFVAAATTGTVLTSGTSNVEGTYVELVASTANTSYSITITLQHLGSDGAKFYVDIATGAASSETVRISNILFLNAGDTTAEAAAQITLPLVIAAGTRVAARCQSFGASKTVYIHATLDSSAPAAASGGTTWTSYGATANTAGTGLAESGTQDTEGGYIELTASSTATCTCLFVAAHANGLTTTANIIWALDIATGAAASEVNVINDILLSMPSGRDQVYPSFYGPFWVAIASGTRISARIQTNIDSTPNIHMMLYTTDFVQVTAGGGGVGVGGGLGRGL